MEIAVNKSECLVRKNGFGADYIYNVCADTVTTIPWTSLDWISGAFMIVSLVVGLIIAGGLFVAIATL